MEDEKKLRNLISSEIRESEELNAMWYFVLDAGTKKWPELEKQGIWIKSIV